VVLGWIFARLAGLFGRLDWAAAQRWGARIGGAGWRISRRDRRRAVEHVGIAFPELAAGDREALARRSFLHLGTTLGEALYLMRRDAAEVERRVRVEGWENVTRARDAGRPILILTGHCGNWELLAAAINGRALAMSVVARQLDEPELDELLVGFRARFGTPTIARGAPGAARALLRAVRWGGALGMLIDQDTKVEGVWVPFLGRAAYTPVGAAELALRFGCAVIPTFIERLEDGSHLARFHPPLTLPADATAATAAMTEPIEAQIRRVPEQWVWLHRRWRRQPPTPPPASSA
jgi:Kdo2-lipid IVA lauroyltransferase/acyltransferase